MNPLVSIALCTYNGERFLAEQLDSIINQTYKNIEIIVVDDCSSDGTLNILQSYSERYPNFKIHQNDMNLGYIKNFEKAINLCSGDFIALSDQDDIWLSHKIALQIKEIGNHILIYHDSIFIDSAGNFISKRISDVRRLYKGEDSRYFLFENCVSGHSILFNRKLISYLDKFPNNVFHDWWLTYCATNLGSITFIEECLVKYRQHSNTSTDILRSRITKKERREVKAENFLMRVKIFADYKFNTHQHFKSHLLFLLEHKKQMNFKLVIFILMHEKILLYMNKKSFFSKLNYIRKFF